MNTLRAFESSRDLARSFYKAFDGVEVLPQSLQEEYNELKKTETIRAGELLVPISYGRLQQLHGVRRASNDYGEEGPWVVDVPYDEKLGLDFSDLSAQSFGVGFA